MQPLNVPITIVRGILGKEVVRICPDAAKPSILSMTGVRAYQSEIVAVMDKVKFLALIAPTGSGKTTEMLASAYAYYEDGKQVIILVPKLGIATGFEGYTKDGPLHIEVNGKTRTLPMGVIHQPSGQEKIKNLISMLSKQERSITVCSYRAFALN